MSFAGFKKRCCKTGLGAPAVTGALAWLKCAYNNKSYKALAAPYRFLQALWATRPANPCSYLDRSRRMKMT